MAPELFATMEANRLRELANRVREYQEAKSLSTEGVVKLLPMIGSSKTFKRILDNDLAELDLDRQLANYQAAVQFLDDIERDSAQEEDDLYDDLTPATALRRAFLEARKETGNARVIFLLGPSGSGKTSARRALFARYASRLLLTEATVAWNDSPHAMLAEILRALGRRDLPAQQSDRLTKVVDLLKETRRALVVEEAHHLGPKCLNLVKTLVNQTPGEFILIAIDTIWRRLETGAYEEARQLTGNRLAERIQLGKDLKARDVRLLVERRLKLAAAQAEPIARSLLSYAPNYGRFAFVRNVLKRATESEGGFGPERIAAIISEEVSRR